MLTTLTRMWLTRSTQPFVFQNDYDQILPYADCDPLGLYVHIPFCQQLCDFCPYCKVPYESAQVERYLEALIAEIHLVGTQHSGKKTVTSLYVGGGTPALVADRLGEVFDALREHFTITEGIGVELHPDNVTIPVLQTLQRAGVDKISIGIQSFSGKFQTVLGRGAIALDKLKEALDAVPFPTVSMDFIFALPRQTFADLQADLDTAFANGANHVAIYPFIDFACTESQVQPLKKQEKRRLLDAITHYCLEDLGCVRQSIWTFAKEADASYSSMTRDNFLGFGCSATTLLQDQFKVNTFSVDAYCGRILDGALPTALTCRFSLRQRMVYALFWTAYSTEISKFAFERQFGKTLFRMFGLECFLARCLGFLRDEGDRYRLTLRGAFYYHHYENFYTLAYIDKMWGILRQEAFPSGMVL